MKLRLNLSTTPQENQRIFLAATALAGTFGIVALVLLSHATYRSWQSSRTLRREISRLESEIRADRRREGELDAYFRTSQAQQVLDNAKFLNSLIGERGFPWTKIFMDLEQTLPAGVRVVNISPQLVEGRVEVTLEVGAVSQESMIRFLQAMEGSRVFSGMAVLRDQPVSEETSTDKYVLDLTVWYATT
jgi:Tfp pilus assembly protein PilN